MAQKVRIGHPFTIGDHSGLIPESKVGEGAYSIVYKCKVPSRPGQYYALKSSNAYAENLDAVMLEISLLQTCKHRNIVEYYGHSRHSLKNERTQVYVLMEYAEASLLEKMAARQKNSRPFSENEVLNIFTDICLAVECLHSQVPPVAHRDLKIENVLVTRAEDSSRPLFKLCDFGSCSRFAYHPTNAQERSWVEEEIARNTTLAYRSPEMIDVYTKKRIDEKGDIWALGVLLYYMCFFDLPFGEQPLQILQVKYSMPPTNRYRPATLELIRTLLVGDPAFRADIWQVLNGLNAIKPLNSLPQRGHREKQPLHPLAGGAPKDPPPPKPAPKPSGGTGSLYAQLDWQSNSDSDGSGQAATKPSKPASATPKPTAPKATPQVSANANAAAMVAPVYNEEDLFGDFDAAFGPCGGGAIPDPVATVSAVSVSPIKATESQPQGQGQGQMLSFLDWQSSSDPSSQADPAPPKPSTQLVPPNPSTPPNNIAPNTATTPSYMATPTSQVATPSSQMATPASNAHLRNKTPSRSLGTKNPPSIEPSSSRTFFGSPPLTPQNHNRDRSGTPNSVFTSPKLRSLTSPDPRRRLAGASRSGDDWGVDSNWEAGLREVAQFRSAGFVETFFGLSSGSTPSLGKKRGVLRGALENSIVPDEVLAAVPQEEQRKYILKATSRDKTGIKFKYMRRLVILLWKGGTLERFYYHLSYRPFVQNGYSCFKTLILLHKIINEAPAELQVHPCHLPLLRFISSMPASKMSEGGSKIYPFNLKYASYLCSKLIFFSTHGTQAIAPTFQLQSEESHVSELQWTELDELGIFLVSLITPLVDKLRNNGLIGLLSGVQVAVSDAVHVYSTLRARSQCPSTASQLEVLFGQLSGMDLQLPITLPQGTSWAPNQAIRDNVRPEFQQLESDSDLDEDTDDCPSPQTGPVMGYPFVDPGRMFGGGRGVLDVDDEVPKDLEKILKLKGNRNCFDCGNPNPRWASINIGVFVCDQCSGFHRQLGTHISKVRSVTLDFWTDEQVAFMATMGNAKANAHWMARVPKTYNIPTHDNLAQFQNYMQDKYVKQMFVRPTEEVEEGPN